MPTRVLSALCALLLIAAGSTAVHAKAVLSEADVLRLSADMVDATQHKNVPAILRLLTKSAKIEIKKRGSPTRVMDYNDYRDMLQSTLPMLDYYKVEASDEKVTISQDGQTATLWLRFEERYVVRGKYRKDTHKEEWLVRLDADGPRVDKVVVY